MRAVSDDAGRQELAERVVSLLEGFVISSVEYLTPASMAGSTRIRGNGFEHAEAGVRLINPEGAHRDIRWAQDGFDEGLWFGEEAGPDDEQLSTPDLRTDEVSSWPRLGPSPVVERATLLWQQIGPSRFSGWSVRLTLRGESVVVCLGERDYETGRPTYIPDCVLVVFDEQVARDYHPSASLSSAWGPDAGDEPGV